MKNELYHHGIKGQRWGIRRFQNKDGSLTNAGRSRYGVVEAITDKVKSHVKNSIKDPNSPRSQIDRLNKLGNAPKIKTIFDKDAMKGSSVRNANSVRDQKKAAKEEYIRARNKAMDDWEDRSEKNFNSNPGSNNGNDFRIKGRANRKAFREAEDESEKLYKADIAKAKSAYAKSMEKIKNSTPSALKKKYKKDYVDKILKLEEEMDARSDSNFKSNPGSNNGKRLMIKGKDNRKAFRDAEDKNLEQYYSEAAKVEREYKKNLESLKRKRK